MAVGEWVERIPYGRAYKLVAVLTFGEREIELVASLNELQAARFDLVAYVEQEAKRQLDEAMEREGLRRYVVDYRGEWRDVYHVIHHAQVTL